MVGGTFLHAGVATPGHDSSPILPLWPDSGPHPSVAFSRYTLFGLPVRAMAKSPSLRTTNRGALPHTPIPARPVEPMSRRQSRGTNLPVSDPFTEIRDDGGVNFKLYFRKKGTPSPGSLPVLCGHEKVTKGVSAKKIEKIKKMLALNQQQTTT